MSYSMALNPLRFEDVRAQVVEFLKNNSDFAGQFDFTQSNIGLVMDVMAYTTTMLNYQVSNTANNLFLDSTTIRKNALSIAKTMGYRPQRSLASKITGIIKYTGLNDIDLSAMTITIPANTVFLSNNGYQYLNLKDIILKNTDINTKSIITAEVTLVEGTLKQYTYLGNGNKFQSFTIPSKKVDESTFVLSVKSSTDLISTVWTEVKQSFNMLSKNSYFVEEDIVNEGYVKVVFGDGTITNYPANSDIVTVTYLETNADLANQNNIVDKIFPTFNITDYNELNFDITGLSKSYGGSPIESLEVIKQKAPKSFASVGRAVTVNDYKTIISQYPDITQANVIGGDVLFPNDYTKLGNVYISAIANIINNITALYKATSKSVYISNSAEIQLLTQLNDYKIISTQLNFIKPSYITAEISPKVELIPNITETIKNDIIKAVDKALLTYGNTFSNFDLSFRSSKINSIISEIAGVISSSFTTDYAFALSKESLQQTNNIQNIITLPVTSKTKDEMGNILEYTNFIRTNEEQKQVLGKTNLEVNERTIYGSIKTSNNFRYLYNEDVLINGVAETCNIMLNGKNIFFDLYRFDNSLANNVITNNKLFTFISGVTPVNITALPVSASGLTLLENDDYKISINNVDIGTVKRTLNRDYKFKGLIVNETDLTNTPTDGMFYRAVTNTPISGTNKTFTSLVKDDVVIYNSTLSGGKWVKGAFKGNISGDNSALLLNNIDTNVVYQIASNTSGNFGGKTPTVEGGQYIIYNQYANSQYMWNPLQLRTLAVDLFNASEPFVKNVVDYEMKLIINGSSYDFGGRSNTFFTDDVIAYNPVKVNTEFYDGDTIFLDSGNKYRIGVVGGDLTPILVGASYTESASGTKTIRDISTNKSYILSVSSGVITKTVITHNVTYKTYFNIKDENGITYNLYINNGVISTSNDIPEKDRWILLCNDSTSGSVNLLENVSASGDLEYFNYAYGNELPLLSTKVVSADGNFGISNYRINWKDSEKTAFIGDIIMYVGNGMWNIVSATNSNDQIDLDTEQYPSALPMKLTYGDVFTVAVSGGNFGIDNGYIYGIDEKTVYIGSNTWASLISLLKAPLLDPTVATSLPKEADIGDYYLVTKDGNFNNSLMVSPASANFVQGDYIIYNGTTYTHLNEYTFEYAPNIFGSGREYLNNTLSLNSVFHYEYNSDLKKYSMYFNDIYDNSLIGSFRYVNSNSNVVSNDIGKIIFESYINGTYNYNQVTVGINTREIFDADTINKISFLPRKKLDINNKITSIDENNFETNYNGYLIVNSLPTGII